jgi:4-diphosphocytidyl-2-C-methyl-D-erythritol kinase
VIRFPNCKINLGLRVVAKRHDGYHDIDSVFYPLPLYDALEILPDHNASLPQLINFTSSGLPIPGAAASNLCLAAGALLQKDFPSLPPLKMHLYKAIPMGAGLGGGSADAAFTLQLLNEQFNLGLSADQLQTYALQLGSDCPFFLYNQPCYAQGRGEILQPITCDLSKYSIMLVNPGIHISTATAFAGVTPNAPGIASNEALKFPIKEWKDILVNDFEKPVFLQYPEIATIKSSLYDAGAIYASMTGTGSTVYGLFEKGLKANMKWPPHYFVKSLNRKSE